MSRIFHSPKVNIEINFKDYQSHGWDYLNPRSPLNIFLKGKSKKRVIMPPKKEVKQYNIKIHPQPDSKRTILPQYSKDPEKKQSIKVNIKSFSQENSPNKNIKRGKKIVRSKNEETKELIKPEKNSVKSPKFQEYRSTQITTIPGPVLRDLNSIKDDKSNINTMREKKNKTTCFNNKIKYDFYSSVYCLPNSLTNKKEKIIRRGKSYNKFNTSIENYNSNNLCNNCMEIKNGRPFSNNSRYNNNLSYNAELNKNLNSKAYRNKESYCTFDMLKPSAFFDKKYELRKIIK